MPTQSEPIWERVDSLVDRQINVEQFHIWPFAHPYPIDVRFLLMDRRHEVPKHRPDHLEVVVLEFGELGYEVEDRRCLVQKNDVIVVGDRIRHRSLPLGASQQAARAVVLCFLPQLVHSGPLGDDMQYLMPFMLQDASCANVIPAKAGRWREISDFIQRIRAELPGTSQRSRLAIKTYLKMILLNLVNHYAAFGEARDALRRQQISADRLKPALDFLQKHYPEPIRVDEAARLCAMSACCFMHLFKEVTGQSFVAYLNGFRVAQAQQLLAVTDRSIADISLDTGFCNQSYFGVIFRRVTGMSPLAYRLNHGSIQTAVSPPSTVKMPPTQ
ncbi:MAG: helix-turn-helix transcriptional regulator [Acidobacteriaceae bacterium]|nr:helix-turn-helix transcriptional regulator [Acidobacteriaceae bacterium]